MSSYCKQNCGFYGSDKFEGYCSTCYKLVEKPKQISDIKDSTTEIVQSEISKPKQSLRCLTCRKKIGIYGFSCKCDGYYCTVHRFPELHECTYDYKAEGKNKIIKQNPKIIGKKVDNI